MNRERISSELLRQARNILSVDFELFIKNRILDVFRVYAVNAKRNTMWEWNRTEVNVKPIVVRNYNYPAFEITIILSDISDGEEWLKTRDLPIFLSQVFGSSRGPDVKYKLLKDIIGNDSRIGIVKKSMNPMVKKGTVVFRFYLSDRGNF